MLLPVLLSVVLAAPAAMPRESQFGTIQGRIAPPETVHITKPVQVAVFSGEYVDFYLAEVQKRLDNFWEEYKIAFIQNKEAFLLFRERAQRQAMDVALSRMKTENPGSAARFVQTTANDSFDFRAVPQGECKIVALVTIGGQEFIWSQSVILTGATPAFVTLKPTTP